MKKYLQRSLALLLVLLLTVSGIPLENVFAEESQKQQEVVPEQEFVEEQVQNQSDGEELTETVQSETYLLNYLAVEKKHLATPETQNIVVSIGEEGIVIEEAFLQYRNLDTMEGFSVSAAQIEGDSLRFAIEYINESQTGVYEILGITYRVDGVERQVLLEDTGITAQYGVNKEITTNPDAVAVEDTENSSKVEYQVVTFDEGGNQTSEQSISGAIKNANEELYAEMGDAVPCTMSSGNLVVVLDPGHDSTHTGAHQNGLKEEEINFKIASYCKAELEQYNGVTVYMTRDGYGCPYPGTEKGDDNLKRVEYAASVGANVYVSIHVNSSSNTSPNGVEVYYPNANYRPDLSAQGEGLANKVLEQLVSLGLGNRGLKIRDSESGTTYPDGSLADYLGVIKNSKLRGIPAILIEHGFISNASDANDFLTTDAQLQRLGYADATAIAQYYGLSKDVEYAYGTGKVTTTSDAAVQYYGITATGIPQAYAVSFAVWSTKNGQDDLRWYPAARDTSGNWNVIVPLTNHNTEGEYNVHAYVNRSNGTNYLVNNTTFCVNPKRTASVSIQNINTVSGNFDVIVSGVSSSFGVKTIQVPVWSTANQSDIVWYNAVRQSNGNYVAHADVANHNCNYGTYQVHTYLTDGMNTRVQVAKNTVTIPKATAVISAASNTNGADYQVQAWHVPGTFGNSLKKVQFAVWSKQGGQDDLVWYTGTGSSDKYIANVSIGNHKTAGKYYVHVYATYSNGKMEKVGETTFDVKKASGKIAIENKNTVSGNFDVVISNVNVFGGVKEIKIPVWSQANQSDLVWYTATLQSNGTYRAHIDVANHNCNYGNYYAEVYVRSNSGTFDKTDGTIVNMPKTTTVVDSESNADGTNYLVKAWHVPGTFGNSLKKVQFAVWSEQNGQDDLVWYNGNLIYDLYTAYIPISNHKTSGRYYVHVYATYSNGKMEKVGETTFNVEKASGKIAIKNKNTVSGNFDVVISNVKALGGIKEVKVPVWSQTNQSDLVWYTATLQSNGTYRAHVDVANHNCNYGKYYAEVYILNNNGTFDKANGTTVSMPKASTAVGAEANSSGTNYLVKAWHVPGTFGNSLKKVQFAVWSEQNGQDDLIWYDGSLSSDLYIADVAISNHNTAGRYYVHVYATYSNGKMEKVGETKFDAINVYPISGPTAVTVNQMATYYRANAVYPEFYTASDAPTLEAFCQIYIEECNAEGIRAEVAFCQAMKETGFLRYGGDVQINQYNFAGLGATGGVPGNSFSSVREGVRAQVQHLKAYASTEPLNNPCVDERFDYVRRGIAPYVEWLGQKENPNGGGWATAVNYGYSIRNDYMKKLLGY